MRAVKGTHKGCPYGSGLGIRETTRVRAVKGTHKGCPYGSGLGIREMTRVRAVKGTHKGCPYGNGLGDKGDDAGARGQGHPQGVPLRERFGG